MSIQVSQGENWVICRGELYWGKCVYFGFCEGGALYATTHLVVDSSRRISLS